MIKPIRFGVVASGVEVHDLATTAKQAEGMGFSSIALNDHFQLARAATDRAPTAVKAFDLQLTTFATDIRRAAERYASDMTRRPELKGRCQGVLAGICFKKSSFVPANSRSAGEQHSKCSERRKSQAAQEVSD